MALSDTQRNPRYHIEITKDGTTVGINLVDSEGKIKNTEFQHEQQARLAIKMAQGGTKHSDYAPPYASYEQRDWSGGRGLNDMDLDETRFFDSYRANTWEQAKILPGPQESYGTGIRTANSNFWTGNTGYNDAVYKWVDLYDANKYMGMIFTAPTGGYTTGKVYVVVRKTGSPTSTLYVRIYSDAGGGQDVPGSALSAAATITLSDTIGVMRVSTISQALSSATKYHVVIYTNETTDDASNHYSVMCDYEDGLGSGTTSANGSDWTTTDYTPYYRITDADTPFKAHLFTYADVPHAVLDYDDNRAPKIFINGDFGRVTSSSSTTLTDTAKTWTADQWIGARVQLYDGTGSEAFTRTFAITDNDATSLTVAGWEVTPDTSTYYSIIKTNVWQEITGHGITSGPVTDVLSVQNLAYVLRGDRQDAWVLRYPSLSTGAMHSLVGTRGTFMAVAKDSQGRPRVWKANRQYIGSIDKSDLVWGDYTQAIGDLDWGDSVAITNGTMEADSSWTSVGTPSTQERSSEQAHDGTYSRKIVADADEEGITQTLALTTGDTYSLAAWVYIPTGGANGVKLMMGGSEIDSVGVGVLDAWVFLGGNHTASADSETVQILSDGGATTFYVDDVFTNELPTTIPAKTGSGYGRITNLISYGEPERLWVLTTDNVYMEDNGNLLAIPLKEFTNAADDRNGIAAVVHDVYLYFSFHRGMERYYKSSLDDLGPNRDEGFKSSENRRGYIADMVGAPGMIYAAYDGGTGWSAVLAFNGFGWHEVYRAPAAGLRIRSLMIQPIPGDDADRLWFDCGSDIMWVPIDINPEKASPHYKMTWESAVEMQRIFYGKKDIEKFWKQVKVVAEGITDVEIDYKVDTDTAWTRIGSVETWPFDSVDFSASDNITGRFVQLRLRIRNTYQYSSGFYYSKILAVVVDFIEQVPVKDSFTLRFLIEDCNVTLQGTPQYDSVETIKARLETWRDEPDPATFASVSSLLDGNKYKILDLIYKPLTIDNKTSKEKTLVTMTVIEA